jgi:hypothetical protein
MLNLGAAVYGTILVGALLAAESAVNETYAETILAVLIALLIFWIAHAYSAFASWRLRQGEPVTVQGLLRAMSQESPLLIGAAVPLLALLIAGAAGARLTTAVNVAIWTSAAMIVVIEFVASRRSGSSGRALVFQTAVGALLGFLVIALKLILH